tara:strand:+ start:828 stop:1082 length:255 start_codon:yes stop_codon:yes gene_type:complete
MKKILYFSAEWCGPCKTFKPKMKKLLADGYPVEFLNVDSDSELTMKYGVRNVPTTIITFDEQEKARFVGIKPTGEISNAYDNLP